MKKSSSPLSKSTIDKVIVRHAADPSLSTPDYVHRLNAKDYLGGFLVGGGLLAVGFLILKGLGFISIEGNVVNLFKRPSKES